MLSVAIIYDEDRRYIFPIELAQEVLKLTEEDIKKLEAVLKKEIQKL